MFTLNKPLTLWGRNWSQFVDYGNEACEELYEEDGAIVAVVKGRGTVLIHQAGIGTLREEPATSKESSGSTKKAKTNRGKVA